MKRRSCFTLHVVVEVPLWRLVMGTVGPLAELPAVVVSRSGWDGAGGLHMNSELRSTESPCFRIIPLPVDPERLKRGEQLN